MPKSNWKVELLFPDKGELPPDQILEAAKGKLSRVMIIGEDSDGYPYFSASVPDGQWLSHFAQLFLHNLFNGDFNE